MKKRSIYLSCVILLSGITLVACDKDEADKLTFDKSSVELQVEETTTITVSGGVSPYTTKEVDETVVEATVDGKVITLKGLKEGATTVQVTDKNGVEAAITVKVNKDPYEEDKKDATVRVAWSDFKKVQGTDTGGYTFAKGDEKTVVFAWTSELEEEVEADSFVLTLVDENGLIGAEDEDETASAKDASATVGELVITLDGESSNHDVVSWKVIQAKPSNESEADTYWIVFTAGDKSGLVVTPLTVLAE